MEIIVGSFIYDSIEEYESYAMRLINNRISNIRINCANFGVDKLTRHVNTLRKVFKERSYDINIFLDISFPGEKVRVSCNQDYFNFSKSKEYTLSYVHDACKTDLYIEDKNLLESLVVGDYIYIDDGRFFFIVLEVKEKIVYLSPQSDGCVLNNKAIYTERYIIRKKHLTDINVKLELTKLFTETQPKYIIMSFCEKSDEILTMKAFLESIKIDSEIIPKIESIEGISNYNSFFSYVDTFMLGRGDLGSTKQGILSLGKMQNEFIDNCHKNGKNVLIATDILSSLLEYQFFPNRAEAADLYNLLYRKVEFIFASAQIANKEESLNSFCELCRNTKI